jgi:hypothetical protein
MSTRAVYTFVKKDNYGLKDVHVYKHHDGYPQGAIEFIANAINPIRSFDTFNHSLLHEEGDLNTRDMLVSNFLTQNQANGFMEITSHYKNHGDLEYRYEIFEDFTIKVFDIEYAFPMFSGTLVEAISKYCNEGEVLSNG